MASLLRSKQLRLFAGVSRSLGYLLHVGPARPAPRRYDLTYHKYHREFSTMTATVVSPDTGLERSLRRIDQDVRRTGRISKRELDDVIEELNVSRSATSLQSLLLIRCCGSLVPEEFPEKRSQLVQEIWKRLEDLDVPMDISHYNALLRVYLENEYSFSPTEFLADLEKKGIEPNRVTYQRLITRYCQEGDLEGATHILEFMRSKNLPVNENVFNALILGHSQVNDMISALGIIGVMKQAGLEPSAETYTTLLCGYGKMGDIASIKDVLKQCEENYIHLSNKDVMDIIYSLAVSGHAEHVDEIIDQLTTSTGFANDAINLILRLINKKQLDTAKKIFHRMPQPTKNGEPMPKGNFFVRQLVKAKCPIEDTVAYCVALEEANLNSQALLIATETCLWGGHVEYCFRLFSVLNSRGHPIRPHYFWPLVAACGNANDVDGILNVLRKFRKYFKMRPREEILWDYAIPHLYRLSPSKNEALHVVHKLSSAGVSKSSAALCVVYYLLTVNKISEAAAISKQFQALYSPNILQRPLVQAFKKTMDSVSLAVLLRQMSDAVIRAELHSSSSSSSSSDEEDVVPDCSEMVGHVVLEAVTSLRQKSPEVVVQLLEELKNQGLSLSNSIAERLVECLGSESLNNDISNLLETLTSGEHATENLRDVSSSQESKGHAKHAMLSAYCRQNVVDKAEILREEIERDGEKLGIGHVAQLIELYVNANNVDKALKLYDEYVAKEGLHLNQVKFLKLITLLVTNGRLEDALQYLKIGARDSHVDDVSFIYNNTCRKLLLYFADQGQVDKLKQIFDALVHYKYIEVTSSMLGPFVKVHLVRNDLDGALRQFEDLVNTYQCTPWKNELSCRLIEAEDAASLQRLTDLSTKVHGEVNSLYDLVFAFIECGRVRQARKILETPGLSLRDQKINFACKRFQSEGNIESLVGLLEATKELAHINRADIFQHLLVLYCQNKDAENALGLWTRMQEEDIQPSTEFLNILGNFLKKSGMNVPFAIPDISSLPDDAHLVDRMPLSQNHVVRIFSDQLQQEKILGALELFLQMQKEDKLLVSRSEYSRLLVALVNTNSWAHVQQLLIELLGSRRFPERRILVQAFRQLAAAGCSELLIDLGKYLDKSLRRTVAYESKLCEAFVVSGQASTYFENLEKTCAEEDDPDLLREHFPYSGCLYLLQKHPEFLKRVEKLALKYHECGVSAPMNMLWVYYMLTHDFGEAGKVWNEYLKSNSSIYYNDIVKAVEMNADEDIAQHFTTHIKDSAVSTGILARAYTFLLDVQLTKGKFHEAFDTYREVERKSLTQSIPASTLTKLQKAAKDNGREINLA